MLHISYFRIPNVKQLISMELTYNDITKGTNPPISAIYIKIQLSWNYIMNFNFPFHIIRAIDYRNFFVKESMRIKKKENEKKKTK